MSIATIDSTARHVLHDTKGHPVVESRNVHRNLAAGTLRSRDDSTCCPFEDIDLSSKWHQAHTLDEKNHIAVKFQCEPQALRIFDATSTRSGQIGHKGVRVPRRAHNSQCHRLPATIEHHSINDKRIPIHSIAALIFGHFAVRGWQPFPSFPQQARPS